MISILLFISAFFSFNLKMDSVHEDAKNGEQITISVVIAKLAVNAVLWPIWLVRVIWNTMFK